MNQSVPAQASDSIVIDPISFEVIRHKLQAIVEEQAITLRRVSGSPVTTEATDFNCGLYLPNGDIVVMGPQVLFHSGTMSSVIKSICARVAEDGGPREGDMFILNNPYLGAIHQPDMSIVAPIFHSGVHVGWAGTCAHQLDVGGMSFGGWAYRATEVQQEAMLLSGLRLVAGGEIQRDVWETIVSMSRLPDVLGLDLKAMIAANTVAIRRMHELLERYGAPLVREVMERELDASEQALKRLVSSLPDGRFAARDYLDHDGHENRLYQVQMTIHKTGDQLHFDLSGTSSQAPGFINCTYSGLRGAIFAALLPILAPDIRWNEGLMRSVRITAAPGTLCNASWPAPVSGATVSAAWVVSNTAVAALSRLVACRASLAREGQAVTKGHMSVLTLAGLHRDGKPYGTFIMDAMAGGGGAYTDHDGLDGSGDYVVPRPQISNVENAEANGPILYLFRHFLRDSAGAGLHRGGVGSCLAITPYGTDRLQSMVISHGAQVPNSIGLFGGLPGSCGVNLLRRTRVGGTDSSVPVELTDFDALAAEAENVGAKPGHMSLSSGDVLAYSFQGGGGYGDPLLRNSQDVAQDVLNGFVSAEQAKTLYGVVLSASGVDGQASEALRLTIRRDRLGGASPVRSVSPAASGEPTLRITADDCVACLCGRVLASAGDDWKSSARTRQVSASAVGARITLHQELYLLESSCPDCGTLLEMSVERQGQPILQTLVLESRRHYKRVAS